MTDTRHVVITGVGIVSPLGCTLTEFWDGLCKRTTGIRQLTRFDAGRFSCLLAGEVDNSCIKFQSNAYLHEIKRVDRFAQFALMAAESAFETGGISPGSPSLNECWIFAGVGMGGLPNMENGVILQENKGPRKTSPYLIPSLIPNIAAGLISICHNIKGPQYTMAGACASGTQAIGEAMQAIRYGRCSIALAGGTESVITPITFSGFEAMRALSRLNDAKLTPRPLDRNRDGMIIGEGAAMFLLEEKNHAKMRGAKIYGELGGYATCSGSIQIALQSAEDTMHCIELVLKDARLKISDINCVYAQAAGLIKGDKAEMEALRLLCVEGNGEPVITSVKGHIGHSFAASGPFNVAAALEALRTQSVSPTLNFSSSDEEFSSLKIAGEGVKHGIEHCLINSFGFGGVNASLIVSKV